MKNYLRILRLFCINLFLYPDDVEAQEKLFTLSCQIREAKTENSNTIGTSEAQQGKENQQ